MEELVETTLTKTYRNNKIKMVISYINGDVNYIRFYHRESPGKDRHMFSINKNRGCPNVSDLPESLLFLSEMITVALEHIKLFKITEGDNK